MASRDLKVIKDHLGYLEILALEANGDRKDLSVTKG